MTIEIIPVPINKEIEKDDKLADLILKAAPKIQDNDIFVISQKIISKNEGRIVFLDTVIPSLLAVGIASEYQKDPRVVEAILSETKRIIRMKNGIIIAETKNGHVCANAGVDESNVVNGFATLLPKNPDESAEKLRNEISNKTGKKVAVLISDTFGRAFRMGQTDAAIGVSGINPLLDYRGKKDTFGKELKVTNIALADELCAAAELAKGKTLKHPVVIIRNYKFDESKGTAKSLIRPDDEDLFK